MKKPVKNAKLRESVYAVSDKLPALKDQTKTLNDEELSKIVIELEAKFEEFLKALDEKFSWD